MMSTTVVMVYTTVLVSFAAGLMKRGRKLVPIPVPVVATPRRRIYRHQNR